MRALGVWKPRSRAQALGAGRARGRPAWAPRQGPGCYHLPTTPSTGCALCPRSPASHGRVRIGNPHIPCVPERGHQIPFRVTWSPPAECRCPQRPVWCPFPTLASSGPPLSGGHRLPAKAQCLPQPGSGGKPRDSVVSEARPPGGTGSKGCGREGARWVLATRQPPRRSGYGLAEQRKGQAGVRQSRWPAWALTRPEALSQVGQVLGPFLPTQGLWQHPSCQPLGPRKTEDA